MKPIYYIILVTIHGLAYADPLIVGALMVKNEISSVTETLLPLIEGGISPIVVLDTGSTDGTQNAIKQLFKKYPKLTGHVFEEPFVNFAVSRNRLLEIIETLYPHTDFIFMIDAEWYVQNVPDLVSFCATQKKLRSLSNNAQLDRCCGYFVRLVGPAQEFSVPRLIIGDKKVRYTGSVHEFFNTHSTAKVPDHIYIQYAPNNVGKERSAERWIRDRDLLLKELAQNPTHTRTMFYLAQTYACLRDWENAYHYYKLRANTPGGCPEEYYYAWYYLGHITILLSQQNPGKYDAQAGLNAWLTASMLRPHRAEPLTHIAQYYFLRNNRPLAYVFARKAVELPYPHGEIGYIEREVYEFIRYDILGATALYVNDYETGLWALDQAIAKRPQDQHLYQNKELYKSAQKAVKPCS